MKSCLVVDDSRVIRKVARRILEDMKFEISEAGDGLEALQSVRRAMPDAILLDWAMPVMTLMTAPLSGLDVPSLPMVSVVARATLTARSATFAASNPCERISFQTTESGGFS